jgi:hypothetical protein
MLLGLVEAADGRRGDNRGNRAGQNTEGTEGENNGGENGSLDAHFSSMAYAKVRVVRPGIVGPTSYAFVL